MQRVFGLAVGLGFIVAASWAAAIEITACGQSLGEDEVGVLANDLNCEPATTAVSMASGATLYLHGYTIDAPDGWGVWCEAAADCTVIGGDGTIQHAAAGIYLQRRARLTLVGGHLRDNHTGVLGEDWNNGRSGARATLTDVTATGSIGAALQVGRLLLERVTLTDNPGHGIFGVITNSVKATDLTVSNNAFSDNCQYYGCSGIAAGRFIGSNIIVTDNAGIGLQARLARVRGGVLSDNIRAGVRKDIVSPRPPILRDVACDRSVRSKDPLSEWGVCRYDGGQQ
jgi:hypothetical protein